jgi:hypothetical protein
MKPCQSLSTRSIWRLSFGLKSQGKTHVHDDISTLGGHFKLCIGWLFLMPNLFSVTSRSQPVQDPLLESSSYSNRESALEWALPCDSPWLSNQESWESESRESRSRQIGEKEPLFSYWWRQTDLCRHKTTIFEQNVNSKWFHLMILF